MVLSFVLFAFSHTRRWSCTLLDPSSIPHNQIYNALSFYDHLYIQFQFMFIVYYFWFVVFLLGFICCFHLVISMDDQSEKKKWFRCVYKLFKLCISHFLIKKFMCNILFISHNCIKYPNKSMVWIFKESNYLVLYLNLVCNDLGTQFSFFF